MFLKVRQGDIITSEGKPIILKGVNLGGWLMMEGYIVGGRNIPEQEFRKNFARYQGSSALREFTRLFRDNFIQEKDFRLIKNLGFNCVRVPFNFRLFQDKQDFRYLEKAVDLCSKYKLWVILDLHAAPGAQNEDWHSDSLGRALLWEKKKLQVEFVRVWQFLARRFKDEVAVAGYDILNEGVCRNTKAMLDVYKMVVKAIREIDKNHIIFVEGNRWAREVKFLGKPWDDNMSYSIHFYMPLEFIFGFIRNLRYPGKMGKKYMSKASLKQELYKYYQFKKNWHVPIYVGEFGQNIRCAYCHKELTWLSDTLALFKQNGFHWTYWTWKAAAQGVYPDGIYQYQGNPAWIKREGPITGWENYYSLWQKYKRDICASWQTKNYTLNQSLASVLTSFLK
jgi:aryl-phospho-beta-D-glucosidase BglC (GH1 family)